MTISIPAHLVSADDTIDLFELIESLGMTPDECDSDVTLHDPHARVTDISEQDDETSISLDRGFVTLPANWTVRLSED